jgi:PEP-CTERM motif
MPVVPVPPAVYTAGIGYLNPMRSFAAVPEPWVGGPGYVPCDKHRDHDSDDCKRKVRTVPEPATWGMMLVGLMLLARRRVRKCRR